MATIFALAGAMAIACGNGGVGNDFGVGPSDDAPTDFGAPGDPNEPPDDAHEPPFGDVAPGDPNGIPGDTPAQPDECHRLCRGLARIDCVQEDAVTCERACVSLPPDCSRVTIEAIACLVESGCEFSACGREIEALVRCESPDDNDPGPGAGGQGPM